jgi:hypothetical protein
MPIILATQEAEIRKTTVLTQPQTRAVGVAQGVGPVHTPLLQKKEKGKKRNRQGLRLGVWLKW